MQELEISGYTIGEKQGAGTFGEVYHAHWGDKLNCAIKALRLEAIQPQYVSWCMEKLRSLEGHPRMLPVYGYDLAHQPAYLSTAWGGSSDGKVRTLEDFSGAWREEDVWRCLKAVASALAWLHQNSIIHTGLTAGNVLLLSKDPSDVAITDIGQGWVDPEQRADWSRHAPYLSPERCRQEAPRGESSGEAWDVYAFGVLAFYLLTGKHPRAAAFFKNLEKQLRRGEAFDSQALASLLEREPQVGWGGRAGSALELGLRRAIERCLALEPAGRPAHMVDVLEDLEKLAAAKLPETGPAATSQAQTPAATPTPPSATKSRRSAGSKGAAKSKVATATAPATSQHVIERRKMEAAPARSPEMQAAETGAPKEGSGVVTKAAAHTPPPPVHSIPVAPEVPFEPAARFEPIPLQFEEERRTQPHEVHSIPLPARGPRPASRGWRAAAALSGLGAAAAAFFAFMQMQNGQRLEADLRKARGDAEASAEAVKVNAAATAEKSAAATAAQSQQKMERENLRQTQELADRLVQTLINQRPSDGTQLDEWRESLSQLAVYCRGFLDKFGEDLTLRESAVRTRWHLAEIQLALGDRAAAEALLEEAAREVDAVSAASGSPADAAGWTFLLGRIQSRRGELSLGDGKNAEAAQHLGQAGKALESWLALHGDDPAAMREAAAAARLESGALMKKGEVESATARLNRSVELLKALTATPAHREEDLFALNDAGFDLFMAHMRQKLDRARVVAEVETYVMNYLAKLIKYDSDHPKSDPCRERLAKGYTEMARALQAQGATKEASEAYKEAVTVLLELVIEHPENESYTFLLGQNYGEVARLVRGVKGPQESLDYARSAVSFLRKLAEKNKIEPLFRLHLAAEQVGLAEILEDVSQFDESARTSQEAIAFLEELTEESGVSPDDRNFALSCEARAQGSLGHCSEKMNKKDDAIGAYSKAIESWQKFVAGGGAADEKAQKSLAWTKEQLKRLRP